MRPLETADVTAAASLSAAAFGLDISEPSAAERWRERVEHLLWTDPKGAFIAERDRRIIGVAQAMRRERLWCLSLLAVRPGVQSSGAGGALMERALSYNSGSAGLIVSSNDARALRLYGLSGFSLLPTFQAEGSVDRRMLPSPDPGVREGDRDDLEELEAISRAIRGAPHTTELEFALSRDARLLRFGARGFAVAQPGRGVWLLVARDEEAATALLWNALAIAETGAGPIVRWITTGQDWALDVCLRAGLGLTAYGALCVRGHPGPLRPFIPSGPFA